MARHLITLAAVGFMLIGCVSREKYEAIKMEKEALAEQLGKAQAAESGARAAADAWKNQLDALLAQGGDLSKINANLNEQISTLRGDLGSMQAKYEELLNRPTAMLTMSPELKTALSEFAKQNPDLVEFDEARGILKFKSDVTFAKGSAEVTPQAKQAIATFARILNSPVAKDYEFMVAGHTDSTPVSNPATIAAGHKNNWFLSAHRAISVGQELMSQSVSQRRLGVAGYGDQRPIASNGTSAGQARNRRVEVAILPTTYRGPSMAGGQDVLTVPGPRTTNRVVAPKGPELNKDTAVSPGQPLLNK